MFRPGQQVSVWLPAGPAEVYADARPGAGLTVNFAGSPPWRSVLRSAIPESGGLRVVLEVEGPYPATPPVT